MPVNNIETYVVCKIDQQQVAIPLRYVEHVVDIVEISQLAHAPDFIVGTINYHGEFIAVVNLRDAFSLPVREYLLSDKLLIITSDFMKYALWVDFVGDVHEIQLDKIQDSGKILVQKDYIKGVFKLENGTVLICDPAMFFTSEQLDLLKRALKT